MSRQGAALSFDSAIEVLRPALPDDALILVGGQAVNYWLAYYRKSEVTLMELVGVTSTDIDFLAPRESVARVAAAIGGAVIDGEPRVPNVAIVTVVDRNGQQRIIDFLNTVYGLDTKRVQSTAWKGRASVFRAGVWLCSRPRRAIVGVRFRLGRGRAVR